MTGALIQAAGAVGSLTWPTTELVVRIALGSSTASIKFVSDGNINNHSDNKVGEWFSPQGGNPGAAYEIIADSASPDTPDTGTMDTWLPMDGVTNTWSETRTGTGTDEKTFNVRVRSAGSGTVLGTCAVTLRAQVTV